MDVCVLTNVHNGADVIRAYMDSLVQQTFRDFELLIVDDGSTDGTLDIIGDYKELLSTHVLPLPHVGLTAARSAGIQNTMADICIILDADEVVDPFAVERFVEPFADPDVGAVGGRIVPQGYGWVARGARMLREAIHRLRKTGNENAWAISGGSIAVRVAAVRQLGGFTTAHGVAEDYDISWRLQDHGWRVVSRDDILVYHRDPATLAATFRHKFSIGQRALHTLCLHRRRVLDWRVLMVFYPLGILLLALLDVRPALIALAATFFGALILLRGADGGLVDRLYGWLFLNVYSTAYTLGFFYELLRTAVRAGFRIPHAEPE
jgi:cellulose synthase/poly-beta-1,6-N-acetylglucosamine synthase-like glycosyltransferase